MSWLKPIMQVLLTHDEETCMEFITRLVGCGEPGPVCLVGDPEASAEEGLVFARLLWELGRPDEAWDVLMAVVGAYVTRAARTTPRLSTWQHATA